MSNPNKPQGGAVRADSSKDEQPPASAPVAAAEPAKAEPAKSEPVKPSVGKVYRVAKGHGLTTVSRGILSEGEQVNPADVSQGEARLAELARKGILVLS